MELKIKQRFEQLISQGDKFTKRQTEYGEPNNADRDNYTGWVVLAGNRYYFRLKLLKGVVNAFNIILPLACVVGPANNL